MWRKFWSGTSQTSYQRAEQNLLDRTGVDHYTVMDVPIGEDETIHLVKMGQGEPMLLFHGYAAAGLFFWKILRRLSEHFTVYCADMPGMGASTRVAWKAKTCEESEDFFIERFEKLRQVLELDNFTLAGHSLGGYLTALYAQKYPEHIKQLLLLSPVGIPERVEGPDIRERIKGMPFGRRMFFKLGVHMWDKGSSPFTFVRFLGRAGRPFVRRYTKRRMADLHGEEQKELEAYMYEYGSMTGSSEYALGLILEPGAFARNPLISRITNFEMPVSFFYGDDDWMDSNGGQSFLEKMEQKGEVYMIPSAGHHLYFDNPEEFTDAILMATGKETHHQLTFDVSKNY